MRGWTDEVKIIQFSTSGPLPTVRRWTEEVKLFNFLLLAHSRYNHQKIMYLFNILNTMTLFPGIIVREYK